MKIAFASDGDNLIAGHFGLSKGFEIFELEDGRVMGRTFIENTFTRHEHGMHGHREGHGHGQDHAGERHEWIFSSLKNCQAVISNGMGKGAYRAMMEHGKEVYITRETQIDKALELFIRGKLDHTPPKGFDPE